MVVTLNSSSSNFSVTTDEEHIVTINGIATGNTAVTFSSLQNPQSLTVMGLASGNFFGARPNGDDTIIVTETGVIQAIDPSTVSGSGGIGISATGANNKILIAGTVRGGDLGIAVEFGALDNEIIIDEGGRVIGGGDEIDNSFSAAIALFATNATVTNFGTIFAELNPNTNERVALTNGAFDDTQADFFDPNDTFEATLINGGRVVGDVRFQAGDDTYKGVGDGYVIGTINMGIGDDEMTGGSEDDMAVGNGGEDTLKGRGGDDELRGGSGSDTVRGGEGDDELNGSNGADQVSGGKGDDDISGGSGTDELRGGRGDDTVRGQDGADIITGGRGDDTLTGGGGQDTFIFSGSFGTDTITDFSGNNSEKIDLSAVGSIRGFNDLTNNHLSEAKNGTLIEDGNGNSIVLVGIAPGDLDSGDFIF